MPTLLIDAFVEQQSLIDGQMLQIEEDIELSKEKLRLLKSRRNSIQPVSQLPTEILQRIFTVLRVLVKYGSIDDKWWNDEWWDLSIITKVCRNWRETALNLPTLWNDICLFDNDDQTRAFIQRSQNADLFVDMDFTRRGKPHGNRMALVLDAMKRVKSIHVSGDADAAEWLPILKALSESGPFPRLKILQLRAGYGSQFCTSLSPQFLEAFEQQANLDKLSLDGFSLPWNSSIFHGLSTLSLAGITNGNFQPTIVDILTVLESCSKLRSLTLENVRPESTSVVRRYTINMPFLEDVFISDITFDQYLTLFNTVLMPNITHWNISCRNYPFQQPQLISTAFFDYIITLEELTVSFNSIGLTLRLRGSPDKKTGISFTLLWKIHSQEELRIQIDSAVGYLQQLLQQKPWCSATKRSLVALPNLFGIEVDLDRELYGQFLENFVEALTNPRIPNSPQKFSPELKKLSISHAHFFMTKAYSALHKLSEHIEERSLNGRRLQSLSFRKCQGLSAEDVEKLKKSNIADVIDIHEIHEVDESDDSSENDVGFF